MREKRRQCVVHRRGWALLSDVAVACLWLLRRPLRRIAKAKRGLDELRDLLRDGLRDAPLHELQALLAGLDARVAPAASGAAGAAPVMRVAVPIARYAKLLLYGGFYFIDSTIPIPARSLRLR